MAARDSRRDCRIGSSLSLRERDVGVRVQSLLNPAAEVEDIPTLTPALSRRERGVYAACFRLMPMPPAPLRNGEGSRKHRRGSNFCASPPIILHASPAAAPNLHGPCSAAFIDARRTDALAGPTWQAGHAGQIPPSA